MKIDLVFLIFLGLALIYCLFNGSSNKENFTDITSGELDAIKNLSSMATALTVSGKLINPGGLDVGRDLNVAGNTIIGNTKINGNQTISGNLDIGGNQTIGGNLTVNNIQTISGALKLSGGNLNVLDNQIHTKHLYAMADGINCEGTLTAKKDLNVSGKIRVGKWIIDGSQDDLILYHPDKSINDDRHYSFKTSGGTWGISTGRNGINELWNGGWG